MLPKTSAYVKSYEDKIKWICFSIEDDELLKKYNVIWNNVTNNMKKKLDCEPIHNKTFQKKTK